MHADHITGTGHLKQLLPHVQSAISACSGARADKHLADGDCVQFGRHQIKAVATPGHTNGCMSFINYEQVKSDDGRTFSGQFRFRDGVCVCKSACITGWSVYAHTHISVRTMGGASNSDNPVQRISCEVCEMFVWVFFSHTEHASGVR